MSRTEFGEAFAATEAHLDDLGVEDGFIRDLITSRLIVERIGEVDGRSWWDSRVLSETGRDRLTEVTPRTWVQARIDLAIEVGQKAESDRLPTDTVSLFSMSPQIESQVTAAIEDIPPDSEVRFPELEDLEVNLTSSGWTTPFIDAIDSEPDTELFEEIRVERSGVFKLRADKDDLTQTEIDNNRSQILATLLYGYGYYESEAEVGELRIPYYGLTADIDGSVL